jgi:carbamoyl-phosphate synthase large subunit
MTSRVLVTAAGSIVAQGIMKSLKLANRSGVRYGIVSADMNSMAAGLYRSDSGIIIPESTSPNYVDAVVGACRKFEIEAIFCGSDDELLVLSGARKRIHEESGAKVMVGDIDALSIARDKWKTVEFCKNNRLPFAPSSIPERSEEFVMEHGYPVVVKPREGYGSLHMYVTQNMSELEHAVSAISKAGWHPMLQKYISGDQEFTTGVTVDRNSKYVMSSISMRKIIKNGQTHKAFIDFFQQVRKSAEEAALKLGTHGAINIQTMIERGDTEPQIIEINPRFSASCPMRAVAGINEPDIVFRNAVLGEEIKISSHSRLFCARYSNEIFVPLDTYEAISANPRATIKDTKSFVADYF